jgi:hypothetical protein
MSPPENVDLPKSSVPPTNTALVKGGSRPPVRLLSASPFEYAIYADVLKIGVLSVRVRRRIGGLWAKLNW